MMLVFNYSCSSFCWLQWKPKMKKLFLLLSQYPISFGKSFVTFAHPFHIYHNLLKSHKIPRSIEIPLNPVRRRIDREPPPKSPIPETHPSIPTTPK